MSTTVTKEQLLTAVLAVKPGRSAWSRGVNAYAIELVESLDDSADLSNETLLRKALLNGAGDWQQYSEGGCALVYDSEIAERVCSPSELKRCKGGERQPNASETWIDVQARALWQAHRLIVSKWKLEGVNPAPSKHTPGPWTVDNQYIHGPDGIRFLAVAGDGAGQSNARLIASAPDLLAALAGCADALREAGKDFAQANKLAARPNLYELHEQAARAAIARATGNQ